MDLKAKLQQYKEDLANVEKQAQQLRAQINNLNAQGRQIELEGNKILGRIDAIEQLIKEEVETDV